MMFTALQNEKKRRNVIRKKNKYWIGFNDYVKFVDHPQSPHSTEYLINFAHYTKPVILTKLIQKFILHIDLLHIDSIKRERNNYPPCHAGSKQRWYYCMPNKLYPSLIMLQNDITQNGENNTTSKELISNNP